MFSNAAPQGVRRWFPVLSLLALGLSLLTGMVLWKSAVTSSVVEVQDKVEAMKPLLTGLRVLAIALTVIFWPKLVNGLHRWRQYDASVREQLQALRWRVVSWLVIIELVLGQNLPGRFLAVLQESAA